MLPNYYHLYLKLRVLSQLLTGMQKALSRKGSCRMERRNSEEQDVDDTAKRVVVKGIKCDYCCYSYYGK
ncbi:hypothetical protein BHE74_00007800 [Ensete ventricosum]|nr:hypothetical protein BHE74_00007800 [Ensete ventricosum]RZS09387.1 hypothetical protein BHM03_00040457 [Ensete ventricosum]